MIMTKRFFFFLFSGTLLTSEWRAIENTVTDYCTLFVSFICWCLKTRLYSFNFMIKKREKKIVPEITGGVCHLQEIHRVKLQDDLQLWSGSVHHIKNKSRQSYNLAEWRPATCKRQKWVLMKLLNHPFGLRRAAHIQKWDLWAHTKKKDELRMGYSWRRSRKI